MYSKRIKYFLIFIIAQISTICAGQDFGHSELDSAIKDMQHLCYDSALLHIENYLNSTKSNDDETYAIAFFIGGTSSHFIGDYKKSKDLLDEIINLPNLPKELKIQSMCYQLTNYLELSLTDECIPVVKELSDLYETTKSIDILYSFTGVS